MYSNVGDIAKAKQLLQKVVSMLEPVLGIKSRVDGKAIDERMLCEIKENLYSVESNEKDLQEVRQE